MPSKVPSRLSDALKGKLSEKGWSQKKLAAHLERDNSTVSLWVTGRQAPRADDKDTIVSIARFLGTSDEHVRSLVSAQKTPYPDAQTNRQRITRLTDLQLIFENNAYLENTLNLRLGRVSIPGLRNRLLEEGYDVADNVLEELRKQAQIQPDLKLRSAKRFRSGVSLTLGSRGSEPSLGDSIRARDAVRLACHRLDQAFEQRSNTLSRSELDSVVLEAASQVLGPEAALSVPAFVREGCIYLHLIQENPTREYLRHWPISAEYLMNARWGFRSGIQGFDFLLDGGWLPPADSGCTIILKGQPGRGKTMFALQTAAAFAAQGNISIYCAAEEPSGQLLSRLSYSGFTTRRLEDGWQKAERTGRADGQLEEFDLLTTNDLEENDPQSLLSPRTAGGQPQPFRGCLVIVEIPEKRGLFRSSSRLLLLLEAILDSAAKNGRYAITVFDSLDGLEAGNERRSFDRIVSSTRRPQSMTLLVSENHSGKPAQFREHLADMVIRFDVRTRFGTFTERVIEIEKCRTQSQLRGEHLLAIHSGRGMTVYPSIQSLLSVWRRRIRRPVEARPVSWALDEKLNFGDKLADDFVEGTSALLSGPPHTHRLLMGLSFLAAGLQASGEERAVLLSLREDPSEIARIIRGHHQLHGLLDPHDNNRLNERFDVRYFPPDYFPPDRFIHWLRDMFRDYEANGKRISRVLVNSLTQLSHNSPVVEHEPLFIDALIELFKRKGTTSLFLTSQGDPYEKILNIFEVILLTGRERRNGEDVTTFRVAHSGPCNAPDRVYRIRHEGAALSLEVDDGK